MSTETQILEPGDTTTDLVPVIPQEKLLAVFTTDNALDPILQHIAEQVRAFTPDVSTAKGRKAIASFSYKVAQSKTHLDSLRKKLADQQKAIPKKIDAAGKVAWDFLQALQDEVRKPLDDWETEQERIRLEKEAEQKARELAEVVERDHGEAMLMNELHDRNKADALAASERERVAREERIAKDAAENARIEAENKAASEKADALLKAAQATQAQEAAERTTTFARRKILLVSTPTIKDYSKIEREYLKSDQRRYFVPYPHCNHKQWLRWRGADIEHRKTINRRALEDLICSAGLDMEQGKAVVIAISKGLISSVKITY